MKVYVESVTEHTVASRVHVPRLGAPDQYMTSDGGRAVEVVVRAVVENENEIPNWKASVGMTLEFHQIAQEGWWDRCEAYYVPTDGREPERCAFISLRSPAWHLHPDEHESLTWVWGSDEVRTLKDRRRGEISE